MATPYGGKPAPARRADRTIMTLVLVATASVLASPLAGQLGATALANLLAGAAAVAGAAAWGVAAWHTFRAPPAQEHRTM